MTTYRLVSHLDGIWLEGFNDDDDEWEIIDGPFDTRHEGGAERCAIAGIARGAPRYCTQRRFV